LGEACGLTISGDRLVAIASAPLSEIMGYL
jgi:hypothetical protein